MNFGPESLFLSRTFRLQLGVGEQVHNSTSLLIHNVSKSDAGTYECRANLSASQGSSDPALIISSHEGNGTKTVVVCK